MRGDLGTSKGVSHLPLPGIHSCEPTAPSVRSLSQVRKLDHVPRSAHSLAVRTLTWAVNFQLLTRTDVEQGLGSPISPQSALLSRQSLPFPSPWSIYTKWNRFNKSPLCPPLGLGSRALSLGYGGPKLMSLLHIMQSRDSNLGFLAHPDPGLLGTVGPGDLYS